MKKRVFGKKLSRSRTARAALFRSLTRAFFTHTKIKTTKAKAQGTQIFIEKLLSNAKKGGLSNRRQVLSKMANDRKAVDLIFTYASQTKRNSGFTRLVLLPKRRGDSADMARLELVDPFVQEESKKDRKSKASTSKASRSGTKSKTKRVGKSNKEKKQNRKD